MIFRRRSRSADALFFVLVVALLPNVSGGAEPASGDKPPSEEPAAKPARKNFKLPGMVINFQKRCVDIEGSVCLDQGMLELIACTKGTKEHESIVAIAARPMHVHTALLLLGANNGNPAMRKAVGERKERWIDVPPRGDPVDVYLVFEGSNGKTAEHPVGDFVTRSDRQADAFGADDDDAEEDVEFPHTFLFAGSHLRDNGSGPRRYLADESGHVISIATFGDELLCLPGVHAKANHALMWQIEPTKLPKIGSKVTLRLRPRNKPAAKTGAAEKQHPVGGPQEKRE